MKRLMLIAALAAFGVAMTADPAEAFGRRKRKKAVEAEAVPACCDAPVAPPCCGTDPVPVPAAPAADMPAPKTMPAKPITPPPAKPVTPMKT